MEVLDLIEKILKAKTEKSLNALSKLQNECHIDQYGSDYDYSVSYRESGYNEAIDDIIDEVISRRKKELKIPDEMKYSEVIMSADIVKQKLTKSILIKKVIDVSNFRTQERDSLTAFCRPRDMVIDIDKMNDQFEYCYDNMTTAYWRIRMCTQDSSYYAAVCCFKGGKHIYHFPEFEQEDAEQTSHIFIPINDVADQLIIAFRSNV